MSKTQQVAKKKTGGITREEFQSRVQSALAELPDVYRRPSLDKYRSQMAASVVAEPQLYDGPQYDPDRDPPQVLIDFIMSEAARGVQPSVLCAIHEKAGAPFPSWSTLREWKSENLFDVMTRLKDADAALAEQIVGLAVAIAMSEENKTRVGITALKVNTLWRLAAALDPDRWGKRASNERMEVTHGGHVALVPQMARSVDEWRVNVTKAVPAVITQKEG